MGETRNADILVGTPEGKRPLGRYEHRSEGDIKMDIIDTKWESVDWIHLAEDREQ
jgi:hypothetical protein